MPLRLTKQATEVGIIARDAHRLAEFYRGALGLPLHYSQTGPKGSTYYFWCGASRIKMSEHDVPQEADNPGSGPTGGTGLRWITIRLRNPSVAIDACVAGGGTIVTPFREAPDGGYGVVSDPEGNWIELRQGGGSSFCSA